MMSLQGSGGFLWPDLPSPPPSIVNAVAFSILPVPRSHELKPGSSKEAAFVHHVDTKLLEISGRYERRFNIDSETFNVRDQTYVGESNAGYQSFADVAKDLGHIIDAIWVSGTPSLQIPFLLNIALAASTYITAFPFVPQSTFELLQKLDLAFSCLLRRRRDDSELLPGFESARKVTLTEKVRLRGIVEKIRLQVVAVAEQNFDHDEKTQSAALTTDDEDDNEVKEVSRYATSDNLWEMEIGNILERTMMDLSTSLDGSFGAGI